MNMTTTAPAYVRIADLGQAGLPDGDVITLLTAGLRELGTALNLIMMHGCARGPELYAARGGPVRWDDDGELMLPLSLLDAGTSSEMGVQL
jgi:hypothetical protein